MTTGEDGEVRVATNVEKLADQLRRDQLCLDPTHWKTKYLAESLAGALRRSGLSLRKANP